MIRVVMIAVAALTVSGCNVTPSARDFDSRMDGRIFADTILVGRAGIVTDRSTGCQYIAAGYQEPSLTPRLRADGTAMCGQRP